MQNNKVRILIASHSSAFGGAERSLLEIVQELQKTSKYEVGVVFPLEGMNSINIIKFFPKEILVFYYDFPWWIRSFKSNTKLLELKRLFGIVKRSIPAAEEIVLKFKPDIIITNTSVIPSFAIAAWKHHIVHMWYIRELMRLQFGCDFAMGDKWTYRIIGWLSKVVFVNSEFVKRTLEPYVADCKIVRVDQAIPTPCVKRHVTSSDELRLLVVGHICEAKGQKEAVIAVSILTSRGLKCRLRLAGGCDGEYADECRKIAGDNVEFLGEVKNMDSLYADTDILLVCSPNEAFGRSAIEGMKNKLPVIYANTGAGPDLICDGINGYLYEQGNVQDLVKKIMLLVDSNIRGLLGNNGYDYATTNYNIPHMMTQIETTIMEFV